MWSNVFTAFLSLILFLTCSQICAGLLIRWKNKNAQQSRGEKHPGASDADILELSGAAQLFNVNLHDVFFSLSGFSHFKAVKEEPICLIQCKYESHTSSSPSLFLI